MTAPRVLQAAFRGCFGAFALDAAFTVPAAGVTALFGPSGCGKTTVLRCIAGLTRMPEGTCVVGGEVWQDGAIFRPPHRRAVGYVFQDAALFPHLSVERNLLYATRGLRPRDGAGTVGFDEAVALLGLARLLDRSPRHLSGGERQRVAIGRALLSQPRLLLMDEPLSALDRPTREEILPFLERLHDRLDMPVLYVSHDLGEVERLADMLVLMQSGRVTAAGRLENLQTDPALPLARARDAAVSLEGTIADIDRQFGLTHIAAGAARLIVPGIAGQVGDRRRVRVAAGDVSLCRTPPLDSTMLNVVAVRIASHAPIGDNEILAVLQAGPAAEGPRLLARVTRLSWERLGFADDARLYAQIKSVALAPRARGGAWGGQR